MPTRGSARDVSLDLIRVVAIVLVVIAHSSHDGPLALSTLGALGVPLFVILTGYLMIDRDYETGYMAQYLKRNLLPLVVCYQVWNLLYFLLSHLTFLQIKPVRIKTWLFSALFMGRTWGLLWFLPMIIGLYLGIPLVSLAIHRFESGGNRTYIVVLGFCIIVFGTLVPTLQEVYGLFFHGLAPMGTLNMNVFGSYAWGASVWILYLCIGYCLKKDGTTTGVRWPSLCLSSASPACIFLTALRLPGTYPLVRIILISSWWWLRYALLSS